MKNLLKKFCAITLVMWALYVVIFILGFGLNTILVCMEALLPEEEEVANWYVGEWLKMILYGIPFTGIAYIVNRISFKVTRSQMKTWLKEFFEIEGE